MNTAELIETQAKTIETLKEENKLRQSIALHKEKELTELKAVQAAQRAGAGHYDDSRSDRGPFVEITASAVEDVIKGYALLNDPISRGNFFNKDLAPVIAKIGTHEFSKRFGAAMPGLSKNVAIQANALGSLSGNLIAQQAIALLKYKFPILKAVFADFSNLSANFNQTIITRLKVALAASQYTTTYTAAAATDTDVNVTLSHHPYAQVAFNANELASTNRDLFGEQAEVVNYAIGLDIVNTIYALITTTNFSLGSQKTVQAQTGFGRQTMVSVRQAMNQRGIEAEKRTMLLNSPYYAQLAIDPALTSLAAFQKPEIITDGIIGPVAGYETFEAENLPNTSYLVGFAFTPPAIILATRVPNDYTAALPGSNYGNVSQVTDPASGITLMLTQYVNHDTGTANYRVAMMYGAAVGDPNRGQLITSA